MGSLALLPFGYLLAGPLAMAFGPRVVLGAGALMAIVLLGLALLSRQVRELANEPAEQAEPVMAEGRVTARPLYAAVPSSSSANSA